VKELVWAGGTSVCNRSLAEGSALRMHGRTSLRRTAEFVRSWLGHQERWLLWRPLEGRASEAEDPALAESCFLSASTVHRWLDRAGIEAKRSVAGQLREIPCSGEMGTDGLWARLRGGGKRVVLALVDSVSGVIWPPVVATDEERATSWQQLFERAEAEGPALRLECPQARSVTWTLCMFEHACTISRCPSNKTRSVWGPLLPLFNTNTPFFLPTQDATESLPLTSMEI
jgi:hypothetical protein